MEEKSTKTRCLPCQIMTGIVFIGVICLVVWGIIKLFS